MNAQLETGFYWIKFNGRWIVAENVGSETTTTKKGAVTWGSRPKWRIDGDLYDCNDATQVYLPKLVLPDTQVEWQEIIKDNYRILSEISCKLDRPTFFQKLKSYFK